VGAEVCAVRIGKVARMVEVAGAGVCRELLAGFYSGFVGRMGVTQLMD
jgi:hypothetical protein